MRLERIQLANFLSHGATDWEPNGTRLAAIVGPNGAGKSALLDGVLYALYDAARARTDDLVRLGATDMAATVVFTFDGQRYRVVRGRTSKGAGKSYLEVAVEQADGSWTSLTGDDIRSTQAAIEQLLGLDAEAFTTSVFLRQGESDAFLTATAGDRKRLLGTLLGLDVYARAEVRARDEARTLDATISMGRSSLAYLGDAIAELEPARGVVETRTAEIDRLAGQEAVAAAERERLQGRLAELAGEIAKGDAAAAELKRLEEERMGLAERYRRERAAVTAADRTIESARYVLADAAGVAEAAGRLATEREEVARLEADEAKDRAIATEIAERRRAFDPAETLLRRQRDIWTAELQHHRQRVTDLIADVAALEPVICRKCGTANVVDQAGLQGQLDTARARVAETEAAEPVETMAHSRERVAIKRLEERRAEAGWDPEPLRLARARLAATERLAGRQEYMDAAEAARAAAVASRDEAQAELARIEQAGAAIAERIRVAFAATTATAALVAERADAEVRLRLERDVLERLTRERHEAERGLAQAEASVARLEQLQAERDDLTAKIAESSNDLARLRRLVAAFGVTGIPARIIEGVLPELAGYANELLGELRPGMVLDIRAQREKRSGKGVVEALDLVVRDDVGERPLALFSGGERMSVSLAIATALSRLVARRAGAAIRSLVVDEPDGLDSDARRSFGQALRLLAHHGDLERVVLVSHHPDLAEYADDVWQVTKSSAGSHVELVA